jgi:hypothetical protein
MACPVERPSSMVVRSSGSGSRQGSIPARLPTICMAGFLCLTFLICQMGLPAVQFLSHRADGAVVVIPQSPSQQQLVVDKELWQDHNYCHYEHKR